MPERPALECLEPSQTDWALEIRWQMHARPDHTTWDRNGIDVAETAVDLQQVMAYHVKLLNWSNHKCEP